MVLDKLGNQFILRLVRRKFNPSLPLHKCNFPIFSPALLPLFPSLYIVELKKFNKKIHRQKTLYLRFTDDPVLALLGPEYGAVVQRIVGDGEAKVLQVYSDLNKKDKWRV